MYPDFIGIGAQKAGTTWLYHNLRNHPGIWIPRKEVHYFDQRIKDADSFSLRSRVFGKGEADKKWRNQVRHWTGVHLKNRSLGGLWWVYKFYMRAPGDEWYASIFEPRKGRIAGEITPNYSVLDRDMISHAHDLMPDAKIILMTRNPIERAWSQAVMYFDKIEKQPVETVSVKQFRKFRKNQSSLLTDYLRTLENWGSFFPEEQIFVGFLEDVHFYPNRLLKRLYKFLGASSSPEDYKVIKRKVHSRDVETMPTAVASRLAQTYLEDARRLDETFGGYASFWRYSAERLVENPPEGKNIAYPLYNSPLWDEWVAQQGQDPAPGSREADPRSGTLSSLRARSGSG